MASWTKALAGFAFASAVSLIGCEGATTPTPEPTPEPTPTPGGPLACSPKSQAVPVGEFARLTASGGEMPYRWETTGSGLQRDPVLWVLFTTAGDYPVTLIDKVGSRDVCQVTAVLP
jgi:hypothetical protein